MDLRLIKKLIALLQESELSELSVSQEDFSLCLKKPSLATSPVMTPALSVNAPASSPANDVESSTGTEITAPMIGVFYHASAPDQPPYVRVGDKVSQGQTIGIIEAMKMMNTIPSPISGTVEKICTDNAQGVEFGQALIIVRQD